jgi:hypothetical protein
MKNKLIIFVLIVLFLGGIFIWIPWSSPHENIHERSNKSALSKKAVSGPSTVSPKPFSSRSEELRALLKEENAPIAFYGIVTDENGDPLSDVEVSWDVLKAGSFAPSLGLQTGAKGVVHTGASGKFSIMEEGSSLSIETLMKEGYRKGRLMRASYGYGSNAEPYQADESKPERFLMIKDGTARPLKKEIPLRFDWDGKIKEIAIPLPRRNEAMIITPEIGGKKPNARYSDWSIKIQMKGAQLITGKIGDARLAPIDGYRPEINLINDTDGQWGSEASALLYIKTADNQFGEIMFSAYSDRGASEPTGSLSIRWNPEGGRVFE